MILTTKRLILREFTIKDIKDLIENVNNLKVSRYLALVPYPYTTKDAEWWVNHCKEELSKKPRENYELCIELKSKKKLIGCVGLTKVDRWNRTATIGYWLGEKYWRQGIMNESVQKILDFAFNKLELRRINVSAFVGNEASISLIKKIGCKKEGLQRKDVRTKSTGKIRDSYIFGLLKEDWKKMNKKTKNS